MEGHGKVLHQNVAQIPGLQKLEKSPWAIFGHYIFGRLNSQTSRSNKSEPAKLSFADFHFKHSYNFVGHVSSVHIRYLETLGNF